jgi:hypothetical protein
MFIRIVETVDAHSGFRLPFAPSQIFDSLQVLAFRISSCQSLCKDKYLTRLETQGGSERHDFHHSNFSGSYGSFFCFWDWLCGTDVPYRAHQLSQVEPPNKGTPFFFRQFPFMRHFSNFITHLIVFNYHSYIQQIARGISPAVGVSGGCIFFNGNSSEHRVAFQQLAALLELNKSLRCSYQSRDHQPRVEVTINKALHILNCKGGITLRWTRAE